MPKKVLSFDVGIINLAYCLLEINEEDDTFKILKWGIIDLADDRFVCEHIKINKDVCGKIAKNVLKIDSNSSNNHYYCKAHSSKAELCVCVKPIDLIWTHCVGEKCELCDKNSEFISNIIDGKYCSKHRKSVTLSNKYICATKKCNNIATKGIYSESDDNKQILNIGWCEEHFSDEFSGHVKKKTKNISQNSNKISLVSIGKSMYQKLDQIPEFLIVDDILVENQPTFINPTMKSVSAILFSYFIMRGVHEKNKTGSTISNISFCSPSNKIKVGGKKANDEIVNADDDKVYKITKNLGINFCKALINDNKSYLDILNSHKKQDDMADAFLQGFIMCFGPTIPVHYAEKIKTVDCSDEKNVKKIKIKIKIDSDPNPFPYSDPGNNNKIIIGNKK